MEKVVLFLLVICLIIAFIVRLCYYVTLSKSPLIKHNKQLKEREEEDYSYKDE